MSDERKQKWSAELNHNYRNDIGEPMWVLRYDPTPGGRKNENGSTSYSMTFPALQVTSWVGEPEKAANEIAGMLNSHEALVEALRWVRANYASGSTAEINARIEAAIKAAEASA